MGRIGVVRAAMLGNYNRLPRIELEKRASINQIQRFEAVLNRGGLLHTTVRLNLRVRVPFRSVDQVLV